MAKTPSQWTHRDLLWLMLGAFAVLAAGIGLRHPWPADEPRFALIAQTMVDSGQYLFPYRGAELYSDKPPLFMWLQVLAYRASGHWNIAFLLPSLIASLGTLYLTYDLTRRLWGRNAALTAGWMLLFTVQFTYQAKRAQIDPVLVFMVTLSCYAMLRHVLLGPNWRWYAVAFFAMGIGIITKGVGIIAVLMLPAFFLARRFGAGRLARIAPAAGQWWMGPLWMLLAIALWVVPMLATVLQSGDPLLHDYARNILLGQTAQRYANPDHHLQPWWYFLQVMATTWMPLVLLLPWALPAAWRRWRHRSDARIFLPLVWAVLVVLFFSLSPGKRDMYILPALPMLCVGLAPALLLALRQRGARRALFGFTLLLAIALIGSAMTALNGETAFEIKQELRRGLDASSNSHWWMLFTIGAVAALAALWFRVRRSWLGLRVALAGLWMIGFGFWGVPLFDAANSARAVMLRAGQIIGAEAELGLVAWREQNLLQADRKVAEFGFKKSAKEQLHMGIEWLAQAPQRRWLMADAKYLGDCVEPSAATPAGMANRREWVLLQLPAISKECLP